MLVSKLFASKQFILVPLVEIQDIIYGPSSRNFFRALKKNGKNEISYASCFSIVTAKKTIDIQANSDKEVDSARVFEINCFE